MAEVECILKMTETTNVLYTNVCIVGGGIGGCALGRFLNGKEDFLLFEKDRDFHSRKQGYGLTMQQGSQALRKLDLIDHIKEIDTPSDVHYTFKPDGDLISAFGPSLLEEEVDKKFSKLQEGYDKGKNVSDAESLEKNVSQKTSKKKKYNLHLPRQKLRELLLSDLSIKWGYKFLKYEVKDQEKLLVQFEETSSSQYFLSLIFIRNTFSFGKYVLQILRQWFKLYTRSF